MADIKALLVSDDNEEYIYDVEIDESGSSTTHRVTLAFDDYENMTSSEIEPEEKLGLIFEFDKVLGLKLSEVIQKEELKEIPEQIKNLVQEREVARKSKDFQKSDEIRQKIESLGFEIQDSSEGTKIFAK